MILFLLAFGSLVAWVFLRRGAKKEYESLGMIPFKNDEERV
ncbi:MAG: hypothetical protein HC902_01985 [Calothrix sp. SM1_5_4]|nr:hypothetical protein [Calothrix sp. SM1_5_4]